MAPRRKQAAEKSAPSSLPDELIEAIFARMPAKSAQRCRCLSRSWAAALSSTGFIDHHLRLANGRRSSRSLFILPDPDSGTDNTVHAWSPGRPLVPVLTDERLRRVAAVTRQCRGLVVLEVKGENLLFACNPASGHSSYTVDHFVYSPSTGQITALPEGKKAFGVWPQNHAILGLGYDASIQKHKVVRLYCRGELPPACEVYVLNSVGHWRPPAGAADKKMPPAWATKYSTDQSVFAQGHVYWAAQPHKAYTAEKVIMSFSMVDEVFRILPPPPSMDTMHWRITELGGRLSLFKDITKVCSYDIWVLRDPLAGVWDLHCRIDLDAASPAATKLKCSTSVILLDIADGGSRVLLRPEPRSLRRENVKEHQVVMYNSETGDVEDLLVGGGLITHHTVARRPAAPYEESLESTGQPHEDIIFKSRFSQVLGLVLRRLPARTLGRLKCVCRTWCAMIETNRFIRLHYEHTAKNSLARVVLSAMPYDWQFTSLDSCLKDQSLAWRMQLLQTRVVSSKPCHGLLLVSHDDSCAHVCNPITGAGVLHFSLLFEQPSDFAAARPGCVGLGYDISRHEHVIVVLAYTSRNFDTRSYTMECSIRRLTDCVTRKVASPPPIPVTVDMPPLYAGGKMYWMGEPRLGTGCSSILAFDIHNEDFDVLPAPHIIEVGGRMFVAELTGQIRVVHTCPSTETMTIWGFDGGRGWTREHLIQLGQWPGFSPRTAAGLVIPLTVDDTGRILLDTGRALGYYDPRKQTLETVFSTSSWQTIGFSGFFSPVLCEDSLVRPYDRQRHYFGPGY